MAWEKRSKTSTRYLTKSTRVNGRVEREYVGTMSDPVVANLARCDRLASAQLQATRDKREEESSQYLAINSSLSQYRDQLGAVLTFWLELRNYRRNRKLHWVKLKRTKMNIHRPSQETAGTLPLTRDEFDVLLKRAETGSAEAINDIRVLMRGDWETWQPFGNLAEHVKRIFLSLMVRDCVISRESLNLKIAEMTGDLEKQGKSPMQNLMVEAVILSWLDYHYAMMLSTESSEVRGRAKQLEQRLARAQKRYFDAVECLARIRCMENTKPNAG